MNPIGKTSRISGPPLLRRAPRRAIRTPVAAGVSPSRPNGNSTVDLRQERDALRSALHACEQRLRAFIGCGIDRAFTLDRNLRYSWVHTDDPGADSASILGKTDADLLGPENAAGLVGLYRRAIERGQCFGEDVTIVVGGEERIVRCALGPYRDSQGAIVGVVGTHADVTEQRRVEREFRENADRFRMLAENARDLVYAIRLYPRLHIEYVSPAVSELTGYTPEEIYADPRIGLRRIHPADRRALVELTRDPERFPKAVALRWTRKDGEMVWAEQQTTPIRDASDRIVAIVGIARDITDRKRIEEELRASEERFRALADNSRDVIFRLRLTPELRLEYVSPSAVRITGYTAEEHLADIGLIVDNIHPEDRRRVLEYLSNPDAVGQPVTYRYRNRAGELLWIEESNNIIHDETGAVVAIEGAVRDITERKRIEEELRLNEERLRVAIGTMPVTLSTLDSDLRYTWIYNQNTTSLGFLNESIIGKTLEEAAAHWEEAAEVTAVRREVLRTGVGFVRELQTAVGGESRTFELTTVPLRGENGRIAGVISSLLDVTERKRIEDELQLAHDELAIRMRELVNVNHELESFSYSVSHDLQAPLRRIDGYVEILREEHGEALDEEGRHCLDRTRVAVARMKQLIESLLHLSRVARIEITPKPVDLSSIATNILDELRAQQPERRVEVAVTPDLIVEGDPNLIRIVLENLLGNAWKYTRNRDRAEIGVGVMNDEGTRVYHVHDNGAGFNMSHASRLFGAFQRLHTELEFEGAGIGLATVRRIIHHHGGEIWADAAVDAGATFYFTIGETRP